MERDVVDALIREQHGVISRAQALEAGLSRDQVRYRLQQDVWRRIHRGVYMHRMVPQAWQSRAMAATLAIDAVASHTTAAALHDIVGVRRLGTEVTVSHGRWAKLSGVTVHQSTQVDRFDRTTVGSVPSTGLTRTVLDLGAVLSVTQLSDVVDSLVRNHRTTVWHLWDVLARHSRSGRNGCGVLRQVLEERRAGDAVPLSEWSRMVSRLLVASGVERPVLEHRVLDERNRFVAQVDLAYPDDRIALELDSVAFHHNLASFRSDRSRMRRLVIEGWTVLQFTWDDYTKYPDQLVAQVAALLGRERRKESA